MADPTRLAARITHAGGRTSRWAEDEPNGEEVFKGLTFGTSLPGGFKSLTHSLDKKRRDDPDLSRFDDVKFYGPGGLTAFEGYQSEFPWHRSESDTGVDVAAVGWSAHLLHDPTVSEIYVSRDLTDWGEVSRTDLMAFAANGWGVEGPEIVPDAANGLPGVVLGMTAFWAAAHYSRAMLDAGAPNQIAAIDYDYTTELTGANCELFLVAGATDAGMPDSTANLSGSASGSGTWLLPTPRRYVGLHMGYTTSGGTEGRIYKAVFRKLAVFGNHNVTRQGSLPNRGVLASDVIRDIVRRWAPLLNVTDDSIEESAFIIPHLAFKEMTTAEQAILATNAFHVFDWYVGDDKTFYWRDPSHYRKRWRATLAAPEGAEFSQAGDTAEDTVNGVVATYTEPAGRSKSVGPVGSGADYETNTLAITDPENTVNAHGIPRKYGQLQIEPVTDANGAVQMATVWLERAQQLSQRGDVTLHGMVRDDTGTAYPAWYVRAGDSITIEDDDGTERRIIETSYEHGERTVTCSLDNLPHRFDSLMERMGVVLVGVTS